MVRIGLEKISPNNYFEKEGREGKGREGKGREGKGSERVSMVRIGLEKNLRTTILRRRKV